jgi:hypothetical protein
VSERHAFLARRNTADRDVERVGTADAAGPHSDEYVERDDPGAIHLDDFGLARARHH